MSIVAAHDLRKAYGGRQVLDGISLTIEPGERVGLVGLNGSGKSTLAKILCGLEATDEGSVSRQRGAEVVYLAQEPRFDDALSAHDVVMSGLAGWSAARKRHEEASRALAAAAGAMDELLRAQADAAADVERLGGWECAHRVDAVLAEVGVSRPDAPVGSLSGGDRRRVALARVLVARPALTVLDEPSNHLDVDALEWLERYLIEEHDGAVLMITHDRWLLDHVSLRTLELSRGKLYSYAGGYGAYLDAKATREDLEARTEQNRQNLLRKELEWLRRQPKARTGKQKARIDRAEEARAAEPARAERTARLSLEGSRSGRTALEIQALELELGGRTLVRGLDLMLSPGDRLGIVGRNGTGKTTLLRSIRGELEPRSGRVVVGRGVKVAYFDQQRGGLDDSASIHDNVAAGRSRVDLGGQSMDVRSYLERYLFDTYKQRQPVGSLSGGERARVALAKLLAEPASLVLLDEPTNDLDVATLFALEEMLLEYDGALVVVTHDRWFLDRVATSVLAFEAGGRCVRYAGGYTSYRSQLAAAELARAEQPPEPTKQGDVRRAKLDVQASDRQAPADKSPAAGTDGVRPLTWAERRELDGIMDDIEKAEQAADALEATLAEPSLYATRGAEVATLVSALAAAKDEVARLTARWEELEARRAARPG
jgi:ATP-binding cassette subfamily F protein uup